MEVVGVILSFVVGALFIAAAIVHEWTWWRRRKWELGQGMVVGFTTQPDVEGDGYFPEIEFGGKSGVVRFVSKYGSSVKPALGKPVKLFIDANGESAEIITMTTRFLFTVAPLVAGIMALGFASAFMSFAAQAQDGEKDPVPHGDRPADKGG